MREDFDEQFAQHQKDKMAEHARDNSRKGKVPYQLNGDFFRLAPKPARRRAGRKAKVNVPIGGPAWSRPERAK